MKYVVITTSYSKSFDEEKIVGVKIYDSYEEAKKHVPGPLYGCNEDGDNVIYYTKMYEDGYGCI